MRLVEAEHRDGIGTAQPRQHLLHRGVQVAAVVVVDEVRDDLGVGLTDEAVAGGLQLGAQFIVVLDDAVVHHRDTAGGFGAQRIRAGRKVWVRVVHHRRAVRRPAGVSDTGRASDLVGRHVGFELGHTGGAACPAQLAVLVHRDAARVVAAVLEALQSLDEDRHDIAGADGADDATHGVSPETGR